MVLSIIIPVYNVERYIKDTLVSIFSQGVNDDCFEVIAVDDKTPDNSIQIVEEFSCQHNNIKIIHQKNKGLSGARNTGFKEAKGEHIWFIDGDDTIPEDSFKHIKELCDSVPQADFYGFSIRLLDGENIYVNECVNNKYIPSPYNRLLTKDEVQDDIFINATRFIFRRDFLQKNNLTFWEGIVHEDMDFMIRCLLYSTGFALSRHVVYNYIIHDGSIMHTIGIRSYRDQLSIAENLDFLEYRGDADERRFLQIWRWRMTVNILRKNMRGTALNENDNKSYRALISDNNFFFRRSALCVLPSLFVRRKWKDIILAIVTAICPHITYKIQK